MATTSEINQAEEVLLEGRPVWRILLAICVLGAAAFVAGTIALAVFFGIPTLERLTALPTGFPADIRIADLESAKSITILRGSGRGRLLGIVLSPFKILAQFEGREDAAESGILVSRDPLRIDWLQPEPRPEGWIQRAERLAEGVDTVSISWEDLPAERERIIRHYLEVFGQAGMRHEAIQDPLTQTDLLVAEKDGLKVQVHLKMSADGGSAEHLVIIVNYRNSL
jgi:hypothetical protein